MNPLFHKSYVDQLYFSEVSGPGLGEKKTMTHEQMCQDAYFQDKP